MSGTSYRGDSPGKKVVRSRMWHHVSKVMQQGYHAEFGGALVLAGHGGDIAAVKGWGMDTSKVVAVDVCKDAVEFCQELYPEVRVLHGDARDLSARDDVQYNVAHLDFCGGLSVDAIDTTYQVMRNITPWSIGSNTEDLRGAGGIGLVAVTMMRGREPVNQDNSKIFSDLPRPQRNKKLREIKKGDRTAIGSQLYRRGKFCAMKCLKATEAEMREMCRNEGTNAGVKWADPYGWFTKNRKRLTIVGNTMARAKALQSCVNVLLEPLGLTASCVLTMGYHSAETGGNGKGTPFVTVGYIVVPTCMLAEHIKHLWQVSEMTPRRSGEYTKSGLAYGTSLIQHDIMDVKDSLETLKAYALSVYDVIGVKDTSTLLDMRKGTLRAWKAHESRGSYGDIATRSLAGAPRTISAFVPRDGRTLDDFETYDLGWGRHLKMILTDANDGDFSGGAVMG